VNDQFYVLKNYIPDAPLPQGTLSERVRLAEDALRQAQEKFPQVTCMEPIVVTKDSAATPAVELEWIGY
jgi:hypothetical protein